MPRTKRLLTLLQHLRQSRLPITAQALADSMHVSLRTIYRDINTLRSQGADIRGEAGIGFVLHHDFLLPPLMFDSHEIEALVFGMRWTVRHGEAELAAAARSALSKIHAVLPARLAASLQNQALYPVGHTPYSEQEEAILTTIRSALQQEQRLIIDYRDGNDALSRRSIWPLAIGYFQDCRLLAAWCELRQDFRHFRTDRILSLQPGTPCPIPRRILLARWQEHTGVNLSDFEI